MKYHINYNETTGQILGFVQLDTNKNIEVSNAQYIKAQKHNKIIINGNDISFETVDWRTSDEIQQELIDTYKGYYLAVWEAKLKELDYDSIATVNSWLGDADFGAEAQALSDWYKAIIKTNYAIMNKVGTGIKYNSAWIGVIPTKEEYLAELPVYVGV